MNKDKIHERFISLDYVINSNWDVVSKYVGKRCSLTVKCKKCGYTKNIIARKEAFNSSCPMCESFHGVVFGVNDLYTLRPDIANMMKDKDLSHKIGVYSNKKEWLICPFCGNEMYKNVASVSSRGLSCDKCGDGFSYPNKFMRAILIESGIDFISEFSPDWIFPKRYDFMFEIQTHKYIVEMDGGWHYQYNTLSKQSERISQEIDTYKDNMALQHGYSIIRINCDYGCNDRFEYIKNNIICSLLSQIINFDIIDFNKCDFLANTPIFKNICELYESGIHNFSDIARKLHISYDSVSRGLRHSEKIQYTSYVHEEAKNEHYKNKGIIQAHKCGIPVYCIETNEIFLSHSSANRRYGAFLSQYFYNNMSYSGKLPDGTKLHWIKLSHNEINLYKDIYGSTEVEIDLIYEKQIKKCNSLKSVVKCIQTGEYFINANLAGKYYSCNVYNCLFSRSKTAGKLANGTKLSWCKPIVDEVMQFIENGGLIIQNLTIQND